MSPAEAFLASGAGVGPVERRIDTHAAILFLTRDRAWKLKRPIATGYLDFSTPDRRRAALEAELELNQRTAPELYLAVHPVTRRADGTLGLGGPGEPVDWVLEMRRFPDGALLSDRLAAGALAPTLADALADAVAAFHAKAEPVVGPAADRFAAIVDGNARSLEVEGEAFDRPAVHRLIAAQRSALERLRPLLDARGAGGRVARLHGDLHAANVAILDGRPVLFDALEFSAELATVDRLYDLAFLLMDLWRRAEPQGACRILNRWFDRLGEDEAALALLPLFLSVRATVRAHVAATRARVTGEAAARARAQADLAWAEAFLAPVPPVLVAVGGLSGTGKSALALGLAAELGRPPGARVLRSDVVRKRQWGRLLEERLPPEAYTPHASARVYAELDHRAGQALAAGQAAVLDAVHASAAERRQAEARARQAGVAFAGLWLDAPLAVRLARVRTRVGDASDADEAVARAQEAMAPADPSPFRPLDASGPLDATRALARAILSAEFGTRPRSQKFGG